MKTARVKKAVQSLPVEMAEEARQETVRIIQSFSRPIDAGGITHKKKHTTKAKYITLTEVFPCFFLSCKADARVKPAKKGRSQHSS
jgi:hypothetical protein